MAILSIASLDLIQFNGSTTTCFQNQTIYRVWIVRGDNLFKIEMFVHTGFLLCLKTCGLVTFHPNLLKLAKADNSDMLFHVMGHSCVVNWFPRYFAFIPWSFLVSKVANWNKNINLCTVAMSSHQIAVRYIHVWSHSKAEITWINFPSPKRKVTKQRKQNQQTEQP